MTNFIPIFPLNIVVFPGEDLNLHIFEPRYKELIQDIAQTKKNFGIPAVINNELKETGTLVELVEISKVYDNGEMDIKTKGVAVFKTLELVKAIPNKMYSGAIVHYPPNDMNGKSSLMDIVLEALKQLHSLLKINKNFKKPTEELNSYDIAHHAGLSLTEEYELLELLHEMQRQEYLRLHVNKLLPVLSQIELLKERVQLNGHFKNLSSFEF